MIGPKPIGRLTASELKRINERSKFDVELVKTDAKRIIDEVRAYGDKALIRFTARFDRVVLKPEQLTVSESEVKAAYKSVSKRVLKALKEAAENIERFQKLLLRRESWLKEVESGVTLGFVRRPIDSVGLYVPGGRASYPSTMLMLGIPARVAGVKRVVACTPPRTDGKVDPATLVAGDIARVDAVYKVGGVQAIAAMAYGTETVPRVEKIVGPGNVYVTAAKILTYGQVDIEFPAGPSEVMIVADGSADASMVASDLISQAEHDPNAAVVLVTTEEELAKGVAKLLSRSMARGKRSRIIASSLRRNGAILVAKDVDEMVGFVNAYAPEHLEIMTKDAKRLLKRIKHAGTIFIGPYSTVVAGDYATGANHVLPTGGVARIRAGLSVDDFVKYPTVQILSKKGLKRLESIISTLASVEGLPGHRKAVEKRFKR